MHPFFTHCHFLSSPHSEDRSVRKWQPVRSDSRTSQSRTSQLVFDLDPEACVTVVRRTIHSHDDLFSRPLHGRKGLGK